MPDRRGARRARRLRVRAFAKINLALRVLGLRADGYHELRAVFQSITLHDTVTVEEATGPLRLACSDPACPADDTNLVWRAADRLWRASGRRGHARDVAIHLEKRIPMQAGLGGGSSDAAAALVALAALWRINPAGLDDAARSLGADVPFFLRGGTVLGLERGDLLFPLADPPVAWVTLVTPPFGVNTAEAFGWLDADSSLNRSRSRSRLLKKVTVRSSGNDLEQPVIVRHPEIGRLIRALRRAGASPAAMSGSGSTVFGLFARREAAERAGRAVGRSLAGRRCNIVIARTLNRAAYQRLAGIAGHRIHLPFAPRGFGHI